MTCGSGSVEVLRVGRTLQLVRFWNFSIFLGRGRTQPGIFTQLTEAVSDWVSREDWTRPVAWSVVVCHVGRRVQFLVFFSLPLSWIQSLMDEEPWRRGEL